MRAIASAVMVVLGFVSLPTPSFGQALGTVAGVVKDTSGAVLPGVTVEAASPALIEKVRTAVTNGVGQYSIVNLPPGVYTVTFALPGFSTYQRGGVEVSINFTATVDGEMRVGAVSETITVAGASPIVDVKSAAQTRSVTAEIIKELPGGGSWIQMAASVPAIRPSVTDVGGVLGDQTGAQCPPTAARPWTVSR